MRVRSGSAVVRVLSTALVLAALGSSLAALAPPRAAAAGTGLSFTSDATWTADPVGRRVHVSVAIQATSHASVTDTRRYFYDRVVLTLPPGSTAFAAADANGGALPVALASSTSSGVVLAVGLGQRLYAEQSAGATLAFDLVDDGGSIERDLRISRNLLSFPVWAFGSAGTPGSHVTVVFPSDFTVQEEFGGLTRSAGGSGSIVFTSGSIDDSTTLSAWFTAVQPVAQAAYLSRTFTTGQLTVLLRYWTDDPGWADQVRLVLSEGYPVLRGLIGLGDPSGLVLTVTEASTQEIGGFAGSFDPATSQVQVSYFADPFVILHEAAHMWFNPTLAGDRWIDEGFASYYAEKTVQRLGLVDHAPVLTSGLMQAALPLNDWTTSDQPSSATSAYVYGATLEVAREIAVLAGAGGLSRVWAEVRSHQAEYQPTSGPELETVGGVMDWRRFLDLLEGATARDYTSIWSRWVVDSAQAPQLVARDQTRIAYQQLVESAGTWSAPPDLRAALETWQFDTAQVLLARARDVLDQRSEIDEAAARTGVTPPATLRYFFESSGVTSAAAEASQELAVLDEIAVAGQAEALSHVGAGALGLIGADPAADLAAARIAFEGGDLQRALTLASSARAAWEEAPGSGEVRLFGIASILAGLGLLALIVVKYRGGRPEATVVATAVADGGAGEPDGQAARVAVGETPTSVPAADGGKAATRAAPEAADVAPATGDAGEGPEKAATRAGASLPAGGSDADGARADDIDAAFGELDDGEGEESAYELLQRGHTLLRGRHNAQAAVVLERAARVAPGKGSVLEALGRAYFNSGQHARAAETFEALLAVDPSAHYGHFGLGLSLARLGRDGEARTHLRMAAALDPKSPTYRRALERIDARRN